MDNPQEDPVSRLGAWLSEARQAWRWSRKTIEQRTGMSTRTQYAIENGLRDRLRDETIVGIVEGFGLDYEQLDRIMRGEYVPVPDRPPLPGPASPSPSVAPNGPGSDLARLWDEVTDLRRRLVELDTRLHVELSDIADRVDELTRGE